MSTEPDLTPSRWQTIRSALARPALRRLAVVFACFRIAEVGEWVAVTALAHHYGGVTEASIVMVAQLAPAVVAATSVGTLADRWGIRRVMVAGLLSQAAGMFGIGALVALDADPLLIYAVAVLTSVAMITTRPTVLSMLPLVVDDARELTAGNAVIGWIDGLGLLIGPAITAVALAADAYTAAFAVFGAMTALGAIIALVGLSGEVTALAVGSTASWGDSRSAMASVLRDPGPRSAIVVLAAQMFIVGALDLFIVVIAVDLLDEPSAVAGWLGMSFGVGAVAGGVASAMTVGRRVVWPFAAASALTLVATVGLLGWSTGVGAALAGFLVAGVAAATLLITTRTILQRISSLRVLAHTFAMVESVEMAMLLIGAAIIPLVIAATSVTWAPACVAAVAALMLVSSLPALGRAEERVGMPVERIDLLSRVPVFAVLPADALAGLARAAVPVHAAGGSTVFLQGDTGDAYFAIASGTVAVVQDGVTVRHIEPGHGFGEYALLRNTPRSATIRAETDADFLAVGREDFLLAVLGNPSALAVAERLAARIAADGRFSPGDKSGSDAMTSSVSGLANAVVLRTSRPATASATASSASLPDRVRGRSSTASTNAGTCRGVHPSRIRRLIDATRSSVSSVPPSIRTRRTMRTSPSTSWPKTSDSSTSGSCSTCR